MITATEFIRSKAVAQGCRPMWTRGIFGLGWYYCTCEDNRHGCDQQCSLITLGSLAREKERYDGSS
jgi:hypothetical protein